MWAETKKYILTWLVCILTFAASGFITDRLLVMSENDAIIISAVIAGIVSLFYAKEK